MYLNSKVDLLEGAKFNVRAEGVGGKIASEYEGQLYYCGTFDNLSEISRKKCEFSAQRVEV